MLSIFKDIYDSYNNFSELLLEEDECKNPPISFFSHHKMSELISVEICSDNKIYYGHNFQVLDKYKNLHINIVKKELLALNNNNIEFLFVHKTFKHFLYKINVVYVIYDDFDIVIDFYGIDYKRNDYSYNLLLK